MRVLTICRFFSDPVTILVGKRAWFAHKDTTDDQDSNPLVVSHLAWYPHLVSKAPWTSRCPVWKYHSSLWQRHAQEKMMWRGSDVASWYLESCWVSGKEVSPVQCWDSSGAILTKNYLGNVTLSWGVDYFSNVLEATCFCPPVLALKQTKAPV